MRAAPGGGLEADGQLVASHFYGGWPNAVGVASCVSIMVVVEDE
ncbi:hypothetical protein [Ruegeria arenilitoris]|nr:hypothetical protein [Ruegeria arenilitoris]